jgi:hypothetical protein
MSGDRWVPSDCFGTLIDWLTGFLAILAPAAGAKKDELISFYHAFEQELEVEKPHLLYRDVLTTGVSRAAAKIGVDLAADNADLLAPHWGEQFVHRGQKGGAATGPNPTDRGRPGTERHLITDRHGTSRLSADRGQRSR